MLYKIKRLIIVFFSSAILISIVLNIFIVGTFYITYNLRKNYITYDFTILSSSNSIDINIKNYKESDEVKYLLEINHINDKKEDTNTIYGFTLKEEDTLKTVYSVEKIISPSNIKFKNLYLQNKIYLLEVKFYYSNTPNDIFVYNYEIVPKDKLKDWF